MRPVVGASQYTDRRKTWSRRAAAPSDLACEREPKHSDMAALVAMERLALRGAHALCCVLALLVVMAVRSIPGGEWETDLRLWFVFLPLFSFLMPVRGYAGFANTKLVGTLRAISALINAVIAVVGLQTLLYMSGALVMEPLFVVLLILLHSGFCLAGRYLLGRLARGKVRKTRLIIVGAGEQGIATAMDITVNEPDVEVLGFVDDRQTRIDVSQLPFPLLGTAADMVWQSHSADGVVIALPNGAGERIQALTAMLRDGFSSVYLASELPVLQSPGISNKHVGPHNLRLLGMSSLPLEGRIAKRLFDVVFSALVLLAFLPVGLVIAALIRLESPGPVIFTQLRHGLGRQLFKVYKFRSMTHAPAEAGEGIRLTERGDRRVTRVGAFLRRTSLDEFPQFFNVLLGQMSVVGPRPHPPGVKAGERIYEDVVDAFAERYKVSPGITGWAQINGYRGNTFTEEDLTGRFAYDIEYIQNWSIELDVWIVLKTAFGGFKGENAF